MSGEILGEFAESIEFGPGSKFGQAVIRVLFGLMGLALSAAGVFKSLVIGIDDAALHFNLASALVFLSLGAFCLFNVTFLRSWRWPARAFVFSIVGLFIVRVLFGP